MVKNLLVLRFGNVILDASFNKNLISNVQITFKEPFGTEGRGGYFDEFGIIRDVMQNRLSQLSETFVRRGPSADLHLPITLSTIVFYIQSDLLQVLSLLTMERPVSFSAEDIRDEKVKIRDSSPRFSASTLCLASSICPTFAALVLYINSPRWEGVPFVLRAGKALNEQRRRFAFTGRGSISKMNAKTPGLAMKSVSTEMDLTYKRRFSDLKIPEAYEALILDAIKGDRSNFVRDDELEIAWKIFTPLLHYIDQEKPKPEPYSYGSRGPESLDEFITKMRDTRDSPRGTSGLYNQFYTRDPRFNAASTIEWTQVRKKSYEDSGHGHSQASVNHGLVKSETIIVELQGVLESSSKDLESDDPQAALEGAEIGLLDMSNPEKPVLRIGNHELEGKCMKLAKPLAVLRRQELAQKKYPGIDESENQAGGTKVTTNRFDIVDIIERKIIFSKRPQPIVAILN
ncbi:hypothetical protein KEM48_007167 [Puccinia striiformis f. sp. tritici PST-130]|nr:hypothetical protein KEM48_007167 [Puccinia striiformis f. sp. tritici PST-130]